MPTASEAEGPGTVPLRLRRSAHEGGAAALLSRGRGAPVIARLELRLLVEGSGEETVECVHQGVVPFVGRVVRLHEHPLARDVLRRGPAHQRRRLLRGSLGLDLRHPALQPSCPLILGALAELAVEGHAQRLQEAVRGALAGQALRRQLGELPPQEGVVHRACGHQLLQLSEEALRVLVPCLQAKLLSPHVIAHLSAGLLEAGDNRLGLLGALLVEEGRQRLHEAEEVPLRGAGLVHEGEVLAPAHPHVPHRVVLLYEAEWAVVHGPSGHQAVVGVEVPLAVAHAEPVGDELGQAFRTLADHHQEASLQPRAGVVNVRVLTEECVACNEFQVLELLLPTFPGAAPVQLDVAHAQEGRGDPAGDCALFLLHLVRVPQLALEFSNGHALHLRRGGRELRRHAEEEGLVHGRPLLVLLVPRPVHRLLGRDHQRQRPGRLDAHGVHGL
mmetsp:Transcript_84439/g.261264  ORF Transcript_84439/g.261264 Transcript_84439/m.261264 type:complete len:444 (-) Transcript_84439:498-1829(-)